jgi:hypothetical protein
MFILGKIQKTAWGSYAPHAHQFSDIVHYNGYWFAILPHKTKPQHDVAGLLLEWFTGENTRVVPNLGVLFG